MKEGKGKGKLIIFVLVLIFIIWLFADEEKNIVNEGDDTFTLMVYMCASDLESNGGYASDDISEMLEGFTDEKLNVVLQTGGTTEWYDHGISANKIQRYHIENGELDLIDEQKQASMINPNTLLDFINFSKKEYPADRYALVLWDHGGGAISGYGYDENDPNEDDTLRIDELKAALTKAGVHFDFIGFDACLMATVETAYAVKDHADYLIASEESEPGSGWSYEEILDKISSNTSADTVDIGKEIVDTFIDSNESFFGGESTLSITDLSKMDDVYAKLASFASTIEKDSLYDSRKFSQLSKAVERTKAYAEGEYDTIDLYNFAENVNNSQSKALMNSLKDAVVYNNVTSDMEDSNGLSVYIPYQDLSYYSDMKEIYSNIGIGRDYTKFLDRFVNIVANGKVTTRDVAGHSSKEDYSNEDWYEENVDGYTFGNLTEYDELEITDRGDYFALELTADQWENISAVTCEVFVDDGEGYIDLGSDDYYETDDNGDLIVSFDNQWITIEDQVVAYYAVTGSGDNSKGIVPATLNGEDVELVVAWKEGEAKVIGYQYSDYGQTSIQSRLRKLEKGDKIQFVFDYYTYDGEYDGAYVIGDEITYKGKDFKIEYQDIGDYETYIYYKITDIYQNEYYTEPVILY